MHSVWKRLSEPTLESLRVFGEKSELLHSSGPSTQIKEAVTKLNTFYERFGGQDLASAKNWRHEFYLSIWRSFLNLFSRKNKVGRECERTTGRSLQSLNIRKRILNPSFLISKQRTHWFKVKQENVVFVGKKWEKV